jgi:ribosomal protein S11
MLTDFYGNILIPPSEVEHNHIAFQCAIGQIRQAMRKYAIADLIVAIERTGRYHHAAQHAFRNAGFETRTVAWSD